MPTHVDLQALGREVVLGRRERTESIDRMHQARILLHRRESERRNHATRRRGRRSQELTALVKNVQFQVSGFRRARTGMGNQLRRYLYQNCRDRKSGVRSQLTEFAQARSAMARQFRSGLAQETRRRKSEIFQLLKAYGRQRAKALQIWREQTSRMPLGFAGGTAFHDFTATAEEHGAVVSGASRDFLVEAGKVFDYLANHPDGTRLTELEEEFHLNRFEAARVIRRLMDDGKAEKHEMLYHAI